MKKTETKYYCDFCHKECTDKHHKLTIPNVECLGANSPDQSMIEPIDVDVCQRSVWTSRRWISTVSFGFPRRTALTWSL